MRGLYFGITILLIACLAAVAADKAPLSDQQLAGVTAGNGYGTSDSCCGNVVANDSNATVTSASSVSLAGDAQSGAEGVNIISATGSRVGVGLNVLALKNEPEANKPNIDQTNIIIQQAPTTKGAKLEGYQRGFDLSIGSASLAASSHEAETHHEASWSASTESSSLNKSEAEWSSLAANRQENSSKTLAAGASDKTNGSLNTGFQAASNEAFAANASKSTTAGGSAYYTSTDKGENKTAGINNAYYTNSASGAVQASEAQSWSGGLSATYNRDKQFGWAASDTQSEAAAIDAKHDSHETFAATHNEAEAEAEYESNSEVNDLSLTASISDVNYRGPMSLNEASGKNIVVDGSSLTATEVYAIALSGNAQSQAKGANIVNAVSSLVGVGTNVVAAGNTSEMYKLGLCQKNVIVQK